MRLQQEAGQQLVVLVLPLPYPHVRSLLPFGRPPLAQ